MFSKFIFALPDVFYTFEEIFYVPIILKSPDAQIS